ncbi:MAG: hypothetical protein OIF32_04200 [Campylobacterales bacterium]|nr:hypothetical protein [Campylobacterales bacterium]
MKKIVFSLLMLITLSHGLSQWNKDNVWFFQKVWSNTGGTEDVSNRNVYITENPHTGDVQFSLDVMGTYTNIHRVRYKINNTGSWNYIFEMRSEAIHKDWDNIVDGWKYIYEIKDTQPGNDYIVQVIVNNSLEDWTIIDAKNPPNPNCTGCHAKWGNKKLF